MAMSNSIVSMSELLDKFELIKEMEECEIDGKKGVYFISSFEMKLGENETEKIRSWTYAIPTGNYFYQINFSDLLKKDDCSSIYTKLIKEIKL